MNTEPIQRRKIYQEVADRLLHRIESGELGPGDQLPSERDLMDTYGVGRPAVREALQQLARSGIIDPPALHAACRFAFLGNLTGLPAASIPVGKDASGLPVGLQIIGDAWDEACVLQVAAALERSGAARVERPKAAVDLLA